MSNDNHTHRIYIAATRQNDGKTAVSLGLMCLLRKVYNQVGYMKPVGQQYRLIKGQKIDKDAILMKNIFSLEDKLTDMSPIAIPRGFTEKYIKKPNHKKLVKKVNKAFGVLEKNNDFIVIEGTGHAGVGSVFDMSNAAVAKLLNSKVILVSCGGIGRPIDEICLNRTQFEKEGVEFLGVVINKIALKKYDKTYDVLQKGLAHKGIELLGGIPFDKILSYPTISQLFDDLGGTLLAGEEGMQKIVEHFIIGDIVAHDALGIFSGQTLLIVPGNRDDLILAAMSGPLFGITRRFQISGVVATYNKRPNARMIDLFKKSDTPLILVEEDSFSVA
ncbi:AAA family ATPase, partial [PVC group bacterium]|nr:AAA family ATPase [PVC group bacterium]